MCLCIKSSYRVYDLTMQAFKHMYLYFQNITSFNKTSNMTTIFFQGKPYINMLSVTYCEGDRVLHLVSRLIEYGLMD